MFGFILPGLLIRSSSVASSPEKQKAEPLHPSPSSSGKTRPQRISAKRDSMFSWEASHPVTCPFLLLQIASGTCVGGSLHECLPLPSVSSARSLALSPAVCVFLLLFPLGPFPLSHCALPSILFTVSSSELVQSILSIPLCVLSEVCMPADYCTAESALFNNTTSKTDETSIPTKPMLPCAPIYFLQLFISQSFPGSAFPPW